MRDCECKGRNPNCLKCEGKGYVSDHRGIFDLNSRSKITKKRKQKRTITYKEHPIERLTYSKLPEEVKFNNTGQIESMDKRITAEMRRQRKLKAKKEREKQEERKELNKVKKKQIGKKG
jgi:hypothetical protein